MNRKPAMAWLGLAVLVGMIGVPSATAAPQSSARIWAEVARWPDLTTGMWMKQRSEVEGQQEVDTTAPLPEGVALTPQAQAIYNARKPEHERERDAAKCFPPGPLRMLDFPTAFFYAGTSIFIMIDMNDALQRRVIMNAKEHPSDAYHSWSGNSIGHWEGDTLVIDTTLIQAGIGLVDDLPSGGDAHIIERIRLIGPDHLEWQVTVEDPAVLQKPWSYSNRYKRQPDWQLQPASCEEGNRDYPAADGTPSVDLTPPK